MPLIKFQHAVLTVLFACLAFSAFAMDVYTPVRVDGGVTRFGDPKAWTVTSKNLTNAPATRIPGPEDQLTDRGKLWFDLGGKTYTVGRWTHGASWWQSIVVSNGTLVVQQSGIIHGGFVEIAPGATFRIAPGAWFKPGFQGGSPFEVRVRRGATFDLTDVNVQTFGLAVDVDEGGTFLGPATLAFGEAQQGHRLVVAGKAMLPTGFDVRESQWSPAMTIVLEPTGVLVLGGPVAKNGHKMKLSVELKGGRIDAVKSTTFDVDKAVITAGAKLHVDVAQDAMADLTAFTSDDGVAVVKTGKGTLRFGKAPTGGLAILEGGFVPLCENGQPIFTGVTMAKGTRIVLGAEPMRIDHPPAWMKKVSFALDTCRLTKNRPFFFSSDAALLQRTSREILAELPDTLAVELRGDALVAVLRDPATLPGKPRPFFAVYDDVVPDKGAIELPLPSWTFAGHDLDAGEASLQFVFPKNIRWRFADGTNACYLTDGTARFPVRTRTERDGAWRWTDDGKAAVLKFEVPADAPQRALRFVAANGIEGLRRPETLVVGRGVHDATVTTFVDPMNRCYYLDADGFAPELKRFTAVVPHPDSTAEAKYIVVEATDTRLRRRFPDQGPDSFVVKATLETWRNGTFETNLVITKHDTIHPLPAPNEVVIVGQCGYGPSTNLCRDIFEQDLCNLFVGWNSASKTHPDTFPADKRAAWEKIIRERPMYAMSIYSGDDQDLQRKLTEAYHGRYLGNNIGEYAAFLYQSRNECAIPMNLNLLQARNHFVDRYCNNVPRSWAGNFPIVTSTCGTALSCYELAGGIDYICNELWAIGAQNLAHTTAEARGAARRWKPDYWCGWNAHEWQTCAIPYHTEQKFDSCYVGFLQEYIFGTSLIVLESGAQGTQAWKYTDRYPDKKGERASEGYDGHVARSYRDVVKKFYDWVKANPRDKGTPETKIAIALGNLDAYLGLNGGFNVWSQHDNAATNALWKYGPPEGTQALLQDLFFPRSSKVIEPYGNAWLAGTPFGQVDVMNVDDESTLADLKRYDLLVFGGWNTMMPLQKDVLRRYVENGGVLLMSVPQWTTRLDRDSMNYTAADLIQPFGQIAVSAPVAAAGRIGDQDVTLKLATVTPGPDSEVVETLDGKPLLVKTRVGKGAFYLFTPWHFAGYKGAYAELYRAWVSRLAREVRQTATIETADDDPETLTCITYGVYPNTIYILNMDTRHARRVNLIVAGTKRLIELAPCEIKVIKR